MTGTYGRPLANAVLRESDVVLVVGAKLTSADTAGFSLLRHGPAVIQDVPVASERGDCEVAVIIPEAAAPQLRTGEIELMYGGEPPAITYGRMLGLPEGEKATMGNLFTATAEWYDSHPDEVRASLELWQQGIESWDSNTAEIVSTYPQHFAVESEEDIDWMIEFMQGDNDWFVESVYMDEEWIEAEQRIYEYMAELPEENPNHLSPDAPTPRFEALQP